jgi:hypothetical protein
MCAVQRSVIKKKKTRINEAKETKREYENIYNFSLIVQWASAKQHM